VRLPFLDFSRLPERRRCCAEELRLNRRFAPDLYLDVVEVHEGAGGPTFNGPGEVVDVAVRMRRFPDGALWSERLAAGTLAPAQIDAFAQRLAELHANAPAAPPGSRFGSPAVHARITDDLVAAIDAGGAVQALAEWSRVRAWLRDEVARLAPHWRHRQDARAVRECHGDLHLDNVLQQGAEAVAFDALEFADELRWIDPLDDLAFLVMDLLAHDRLDLGFRLLNAYLEASGDYEGLPALRFFLVSRALVRAQVVTLRSTDVGSGGRDDAALGYLRLAAALVRGHDPRLAITCGLPGSGKTFVSQSLAETIGAVRVRSDVERKRLFGVAPLQSSRERAEHIYDDAATERTYARLLAVARTALGAGWPTLVDAAFLRRGERARFAALAAAGGVPFAILHCHGETALLRQRIVARHARADDASEADIGVLERLTKAAEPLDAAEAGSTIDCDAAALVEPAELARRWRALP
jgi:aminoglycoside phosphotransferase family enzyme/predicted kinase